MVTARGIRFSATVCHIIFSLVSAPAFHNDRSCRSVWALNILGLLLRTVFLVYGPKILQKRSLENLAYRATLLARVLRKEPVKLNRDQHEGELGLP